MFRFHVMENESLQRGIGKVLVLHCTNTGFWTELDEAPIGESVSFIGKRLSWGHLWNICFRRWRLEARLANATLTRKSWVLWRGPGGVISSHKCCFIYQKAWFQNGGAAVKYFMVAHGGSIQQKLWFYKGLQPWLGVCVCACVHARGEEMYINRE